MTSIDGRETGVALVIAAMATLLLMALGAALVLMTSTETTIAANFRIASEAFYAADAVLERALSDLQTVPDWTTPLDGTVRSSFAIGPPSGSRTLAGGSTIDLEQITNEANCRKSTACSPAEMDAVTVERPWGADNPRWRVFAYGNLSELRPGGSLESQFYVVALVGDDPSENDGDPARDGGTSGALPNPGAGVLTVRGESFGPRGARKTVEATVARVGTESEGGDAGIAGLRVLSWRELR